MNESKSDLRLALDAWRRLVVECDMKEKTQHATYRAVKTYHGGKPWYVQEPPKREWQGLTDDEYSQLHDGLYQQGKSLGWVVDQIEEKLKERNL